MIGEHGLELRPEAEEWIAVLDRLTGSIDLPVERKRLTASYHFATRRTRPQRAAARDRRRACSGRRGCRALGRKVLELRPPIDAHKGTAIAYLLESRGIDRAMFAGDDDTDLDGFGAVAQLELGVRIAVASTEGPRAVEAADLVVDGPDELLELRACSRRPCPAPAEPAELPRSPPAGSASTLRRCRFRR